MSHQGLVISNLGKALAVEIRDETTGNEKIILCKTRRKLGVSVVGDQVAYKPDGEDEGVVTQILPRANLLSRPAKSGRTRPVAANIDQLAVLITVSPSCDFLLLDQFLVVCEHSHFNPLLIFNKTDLLADAESEQLQQSLMPYRKMGYLFNFISAKTGRGIADLNKKLINKRSLLVGQSGVGKSSLTNALLPEKALRVNAVSASSGLGRHTTTAATLFHLPEGGDLIDSPGVNIFGLAGIDERALAESFRDFQPHLPNCKFNDCRHQQDKGCAIREAVKSGEIAPERYKRFLKLIEKLPR
ncbi:MAG: ribosome small subunit-dependent GTPase A [Gammaproteobacteria bacterium]|nr:MAG: ribosome small subunit-dependent GTPase A [Gammaproteobacteria bacterium]